MNTGIVATGQANGASVQTDIGSIALWIGFAVTVTATIVLLFLSYIRNLKPEGRLVYYLVTILNAISALAYLTMALGGTLQTTHNGVRAFQWIRFAQWALQAPLTFVTLTLVSGAHWVDLIWVSFAALVGLAGGYAATISAGFNATWPLFTFAVVTFLPVFIALAFTFRRAAYKVHPEIGKLYDILAFGSLVAYAGYAITWAVSEGGYITTVDQELVIYAALDIVTKTGFAYLLISGREAIARYGSVWGQLNTGMDIDFPIARSTYTGSGSAYAAEPTPAVTFGEQRDLAFAQLHAATNTGLTKRNV